MAKWTIGDETVPDVVIEVADGGVSIHMPSPDPVVFTTKQAEEIRAVLGAAIGAARQAEQ